MQLDGLAVKGYIITCDDFFWSRPLPVKTAPKKKAAKAAELAPNAFKERAATIKYEAMAKELVKAAIAERQLSTRELQQALAKIGVEIREDSLTNKISRGAYSAAFLLQLHDALGLQLAAKPKR